MFGIIRYFIPNIKKLLYRLHLTMKIRPYHYLNLVSYPWVLKTSIPLYFYCVNPFNLCPLYTIVRNRTLCFWLSAFAQSTLYESEQIKEVRKNKKKRSGIGKGISSALRMNWRVFYQLIHFKST
jgi:hypothetical protein